MNNLARLFDLAEGEESALQTCWKYGNSFRAKITQNDRNEMASVNIVDSCNKVSSLIAANEGPQWCARHFKDMVRLTQGISNIYSHQVERLLDDTRLLLEQTRRTTLSFEKITHESVEVEVRTHKRKRVITKKATITKRARFSEPNLLDSPTREYYSQMLFDSEQWQTESPEEVQEELQVNSIETRCTYELTISEEIETQDHQAGIFPSDGFGETEPDLSIFEELYPRRTASKRTYMEEDPTEVLPAKIPRLEDHLEEFQPRLEPQNLTDIIPSIMPSFESHLEDVQNPTGIISGIVPRLESQNPTDNISSIMPRLESHLEEFQTPTDIIPSIMPRLEAQNLSDIIPSIMPSFESHLEDLQNLTGIISGIVPRLESENPTDNISSIMPRLESHLEEIQNPNDIISSIMPRSETQKPTDNISSIWPRFESPFEEIQNPTDTISSIIARLDSPVEEIQNPTDIISSITLRLESTTKEPATGIVSEPVDLPRNRQRKSKKGKLLIDNCIKYSKDQLMKHRKKYAEDSMDRIIVATLATEQMKKASVLLSNLEKRSVFPDLLKNLKIKKEEVKDEGENILRSIFGDDYNEDIAEEILRPKPSQKTRKKSQPLEIIPVSTSPIIEPNNNNLCEKTLQKNSISTALKPIANSGEEEFSSYSIMMDLLQIWRNHLDVEGIDAEEFIKSFRSRAKAALAFNYLLYLSRDKFIKITKKPNSLKMDTILIGEESRKLIENVAEETISETI